MQKFGEILIGVGGWLEKRDGAADAALIVKILEINFSTSKV